LVEEVGIFITFESLGTKRLEYLAQSMGNMAIRCNRQDESISLDTSLVKK